MNRYLLFPLRSTPLLLVATFTFGLVVASKAGLMGLPFALLLVSWFFKYCFVVLDSIVAGEEEPPVLSVEMVNPIDEQRPLGLACLIGCEIVGILALRRVAGSGVSACATALLIAALPANIALLGVTRSAFQFLWPPALVSTIGALGYAYLWLIGALLAAAGAGYWLLSHSAPPWVMLAVFQLLFLMVFAVVAGMLFEHRHALGIETRTRREMLMERKAREHESERRGMLDRAYSGFRVHKPEDGWQEIATWLRRHGQGENQLIEYRSLVDAASAWDDTRAGDRLANDLLGLLLTRRATGEALGVAERRFATNPAFHVQPKEHALRLAELAQAAGKRALHRKLLQDAVAR